MLSHIYAKAKEKKPFTPVGYVQYYKEQLCAIFHKLTNKPTYYSLQDKIELYILCEKEKFHFANRIYKTHKTNIPVLVIYMKMLGFVRETIDKEMAKRGPIQLEFDFMKKLKK